LGGGRGGKNAASSTGQQTKKKIKPSVGTACWSTGGASLTKSGGQGGVTPGKIEGGNEILRKEMHYKSSWEIWVTAKR